MKSGGKDCQWAGIVDQQNRKSCVSVWTMSALLVFALIGRMKAEDSPREPNPEHFPTHEWLTSAPESQGMDSQTLADALDFIRAQKVGIHSLLIVRNGRIVLDSYFFPFQVSELHDIASVTKSITATLVGMAIAQHKIGDVHQTLLSFFADRRVANRNPWKEQITIEHLLTMTSGLDCRIEPPNEITLNEMTQSRDWIQFMLNLPMADEPGSRFVYCSGGMHLLSGIVSRATGLSELEFARTQLFEPLGIRQVIWPSDSDGVTHGWGDLYMQPRDMAKIGYLWLNQGRWGDRQIVPSEWIGESTKVHSRPAQGRGYGYGIWIYPDRNPPVYGGLGRGGQRISILPNKNLVAVFTGGTFDPDEIGGFIVRAIKSDAALPDNSAGVARLNAAVLGAAQPPSTQAIHPCPSIGKTISGQRFILDTNPFGLKSLTLYFPEGSEALLRSEFTDGRTEERPIGLDGVPRRSADGRFGLPVAISGSWIDDNTFAFDYDEIASINLYYCRLSFSGTTVSILAGEKSGRPLTTTFTGRLIPE
jgi:CubicO group peptidase (beta-lactamase class C family)